MAASSVRCLGIVPVFADSSLNVSNQRCTLRLRTKSSYQGTSLEDSRATNIRIRRRIYAEKPSVSTGSVTVLDNGVIPARDNLTAVKENEFIGYGCLLDDKTFRERFVIRFSEVSSRGKISLETLASLIQEAATNHVLKMDYGFSPANMNGNITVTTRMHIEVDRYPEWRDLVEIDTWFQREGKNSVRRDWIVRDVKTGENMAFATSTWVLMNSQTRRLCKMTEDLWQELEPHMRSPPPKWSMSEERRKESSTKIPKLDEEAAFRVEGVVASEKDCDMNNHVNNVRYLSWMIETVSEEVKRLHEVSKITIEYRQEASQGECVHTVADIEKTENCDYIHFTHLTRRSSDGKEINRGRTVWRSRQ